MGLTDLVLISEHANTKEANDAVQWVKTAGHRSDIGDLPVNEHDKC